MAGWNDPNILSKMKLPAGAGAVNYLKPVPASQPAMPATPPASNTPTPSAGAVPPMPIVNQINAFKTTYETAKASGASQTVLDQISGAASNYRKQNGLMDDDQRFGTEAGLYTPPMPQQKPIISQTATPPTPVAAAATPATPSTVAAPQYGMTPDQIQQEAAARINRLIADKTRVANQTKGSLDTSYNRGVQDMTEQRNLENVTNQRQLNPFSGRSDYAQGMIAMERGKTDRQMAEDLQTRKGQVDSQLNDFLSAAPEQQQQMINELTRIERDYGLQVGSLTGSFGGNRTLAGQQFDWSKQMDWSNLSGQMPGGQTPGGQMSAGQAPGGQMSGGQMTFPAMMQMAQLTGQMPNGQSTLQGKQANWGAYKDAVDMTGHLGNGPTDNWGDLLNMNGPMSMQGQQVMAQLTGQIPDGKGGMMPTSAEQQRQIGNYWTVAQQTGTIPNELADMYGLPRGSRTMDAIHSAQQMSISQQNANTSAASQGTSATNQRIGALMDVWRSTGKAPAGLESMGVQQGTAYYDPVAARQSNPTSTSNGPTKNDVEAGYIGNLEGLPPENRKAALKQEKSAIVAKIGISGYNTLWNMYVDANGNPK